MRKHLYSVRDRLTDFGPSFEAPNHDVAKRMFKQSLSGGSVMPIEDLDLYYIGDFDTESGLISVGDVFPVFIARGASLLEVKKDDDV